MSETISEGAVMSATELPDAAVLIGAARAAMAGVKRLPADPAEAAEKRRQAASKALDQWAPAIDELTDLDGAAVFLGLKGKDSIRRRTSRRRADGTRQWPEPDKVFGRTPAWKYRSIVINQADSPGRGHPGATLGRTNTHRPWDARRGTAKA